MKKLLLFCLVMATMLAACTPYMYGVPMETWNRMSETERIEAMRVYEQEQQARRQAAEERARRLALERERERARQEALERARRERIEAIHRGDGAYGELIRVRLQGGRIRIGGEHYRYEPITFTIADGETRQIPVADYRGREVDLVVTYAGGALAIEGVRFPYDRRWGRGVLYPGTSTGGPLELRGVDLEVQVRDRSSQFDREPPRLMIVRDEPPPVVIVREDRRPEPPVVIIREERRPELPRPQARERDGDRDKDYERDRGRGRQQEQDDSKSPPAPARPPESPRQSSPVHQTPPQPQPAPRAPQPTPSPRQPSPAVTGQVQRQVEVVFVSGEMMVRGRYLKLDRAVVRIAEGESRDLTLNAGGGRTTVTIQYRNGEISFDSEHFAHTAEWQRGKEYRFSLRTRIPLQNLRVRVTGK